MPEPTLVRRSDTFSATGGGGTVTLLLTVADGPKVSIGIHREVVLPHETLVTTVLELRHPAAGLEPVAREASLVMAELERLHRVGYTTRRRATGTWSGRWDTDLIAPSGQRVVSWPVQVRRPEKTLAPLTRKLARFSPAAPASRKHEPRQALLREMRRVGDEQRRTHQLDDAIAEHASLPIDDLLTVLDERGLLDPLPDEE